MKRIILLCNLLIGCSLGANASPVLVTGTPGNAQLATPTGPSPSFGTLINFDTLPPNTALNPSQYSSQGVTSIASPDGLTAIPFSAQSFPNEIFDGGANGTANIAIHLSAATIRIGIGIADSDPTTVTLQALDINGLALGSAFTVTVPENTINPGNGYFVISDNLADLGGLQILQTSGASGNSGMAIDDLQVASVPEPASLALSGISLLAFGLRLRKKSN